MNEILRDLINKDKVVAFIDKVLVETETEKGHNEIVKEYQRGWKKMTCISSQKSMCEKYGK